MSKDKVHSVPPRQRVFKGSRGIAPRALNLCSKLKFMIQSLLPRGRSTVIYYVSGANLDATAKERITAEIEPWLSIP
jgi:hypothetical protein